MGRRLHAHCAWPRASGSARAGPRRSVPGRKARGGARVLRPAPDEMDRLEREFVAASQSAAEREAAASASRTGGCARSCWRRGTAGARGGGRRGGAGRSAAASSDARLAVAEAHAALGRQLGAEATAHPGSMWPPYWPARRSPGPLAGDRRDTALDARASPAVVGTFALPTTRRRRSRSARRSDPGRVRQRLRRRAVLRRANAGPGRRKKSDFFGDQRGHSRDGSCSPTGRGVALVRDAHTLVLRARLPIGPRSRSSSRPTCRRQHPHRPGRPHGLYGYWLMSAGGQPAAAWLARRALPGGRRLAPVPLGRGRCWRRRSSAAAPA